MHKAIAQRLTLGVLSLTLLVGCGGTEDDGAAQQSTAAAAASTTPSTTAPPETTAAVAATATSDDALRAAVQGYSDGFLGGDPAMAYDYFSTRCQAKVSLAYFTGIVMAAKVTYGSALPITSYDAQVSGDLARVTYAYDVPALNQTDEPWSRESGAWKQDDC
jgi:hypothetical protein